jgi:TRAP-type mannitol/chloroaromatic compound transport system substrate-binding protein
MQRRDFLKSAIGLPALFSVPCADGCMAAPAVVADPHLHLRVATPWPASSGGFSDDAFSFCKGLERLAQGRATFELVTLTGDSFSHLASGAADAVIGLEHGKVSTHPAFGYFAGLPGTHGMPYDVFEGWLSQGDGQRLWDRLSADFGTKSMLVGHTGPQPGFWSATAMTTTRDWAGQSIAVEGLAAEVVLGLGGIPLPPDATTLADDLKTGRIRAADPASLTHGLACALDRTAPWLTTSSLVPNGHALSLTMSKKLWTSLGGEMRTLITAAAAGHRRRAHAKAAATTLAVRDVLTARGQLHVYAFPPLLDATGSVADAVVADIATRDRHAREINAGYFEHAPGKMS